jgi:hypothetical protein
MNQDQRELIERIHRDALEHYQNQPEPPVERPAISYTELPAAMPDSPLAQEWNTYLREVGRLLGEGGEGKFALIQGDTVIGIFDKEEDALKLGYEKYLLQRPFLVQPIRERETVLRLSWHNRPCRT